MKIIILNGPAGAGKTSLAKKSNDKIPMSFFIEFDELRRHVGAYKKNPHDSRNLVFGIAFSITETCFQQGKDVIIDKMMSDTIEKGENESTLDTLISIAEKHGAEIYEFIIWADKETVLRRFEERGYPADGRFTSKDVEKYWEDMEKFKEKRSQAILIDTSNTTEDGAFNQIWGAIYS